MTQKTQYVFRCSGRIDEAMYYRFKRFCEDIPITSVHKKLYFYIMSKGGYVGWASKIIELITSLSNIEVVTIAYTMAHSSALLIFAAGDYRIAKNKDVQFLLHYPAKDDKDISDEQVQESGEAAFRFIAERIEKPIDIVKDLAANTTYLDAAIAKEIGLVHEILSS